MRLFFLLLIALLACHLPARGEQEENRFLFILETSAAMKEAAPSAKSALLNLVRSGLPAVPGDTFGVWTFNEAVQSGQFPMQEWAGDKTDVTALARHLDQLRFTGGSALKNVFPQLQSILKNSPYLTVILISTGRDPVVETPFDQEISALFRAHYREQNKARQAFVTLLRAENGTFLDYTVNPSQGPIRVPARPRPPGGVVAAAAAVVVPATNTTSVIKTKTEPPVVTEPAKVAVLPKIMKEPAAVVPSPVPVIELPKVETSPQTVEAPKTEPVPVPVPVPVAQVTATPQLRGMEPPKTIAPPAPTPARATAEKPGLLSLLVSPAGWIVGGLLLCLAAGLVGMYLLRRSRRGPSLISSAMPQHKPAPKGR